METIPLSPECVLLRTRLPDSWPIGAEDFERLWRLHPTEYPEVRIHGRFVKTPRWQAIFGADYHFSGGAHRALPVPAEFAPFLEWGRGEVEPRLNGVVVNWYDSQLSHRIGRHRDSTVGMLAGAPIVMISLGAARTLRMRPWRRKGYLDFVTAHGDVYILPYHSNLAWTHEVPHFANDEGRRISVTLRAFKKA
jgi:alkylated DNA repair dioxygenase AlkB